MAYSYIANTVESIKKQTRLLIVLSEKRQHESPEIVSIWYLELTIELTIYSNASTFSEPHSDRYGQVLMSLLPFFFADNNNDYVR